MSRARDRRGGRSFGRRENFRDVRPVFLIVCEDGKSAPNYFRGFRLTSAKIIPVGAGMNTLQLVEHAIRMRTEYALSEGKDQTWVVMDRNSFPQDHYDNALHKAKSNGILIAFANECFEVWVHLHFEYTTAYVPRATFPQLLSEQLDTTYEKGMNNLYELLLPRQNAAISNAKKLLESCRATGRVAIPNCCPSTSVHCLVIELNKHL